MTKKATKKATKMPKSVKVGYFNYTIKENEDLVENLGLTKLDKLIIEITPSYPEQIVKETLLHECLHAILKDSFLFNDEIEENLVSMISPQIMMVMKDNPDLKSYLFD